MAVDRHPARGPHPWTNASMGPSPDSTVRGCHRRGAECTFAPSVVRLVAQELICPGRKLWWQTPATFPWLISVPCLGDGLVVLENSISSAVGPFRLRLHDIATPPLPLAVHAQTLFRTFRRRAWIDRQEGRPFLVVRAVPRSPLDGFLIDPEMRYNEVAGIRIRGLTGRRLQSSRRGAGESIR